MDQDLIELTKQALRSPENSAAAQYWLERLSPLLGGDSWLGEGDPVLLDGLAAWATTQDEDGLRDAVGQADADHGAALVDWLGALLNREPSSEGAETARDDTSGEASEGDFFASITEVGDGWWAGQDRQTGEYWYLQSDQRPDASTPGWVRQPAQESGNPADDAQAWPDSAEAEPGADPADQVPEAELYVNISPVDGYPGWWVGWDTTNAQWSYVNAGEAPDSSTPGWLTQDEAFALMASQTQAPDSAATSAPADPASYPPEDAAGPPGADSGTGIPAEVQEILADPDPELAAALAEFDDPATLFDGFDLTGYTPEQIRQALIEASQLDSALDSASAQPEETVEPR